VAYFILRSQDLLLAERGPFAGGAPLGGPRPDVTWRAMARAYHARRAELDAGRVHAPGSDRRGVPDRDTLVEGVLQVQPRCTYCDYDALCGAAFGR